MKPIVYSEDKSRIEKINKYPIILKPLIAIYLFSLFFHLLVVIYFIDQPIALDDMYQYDMIGRSLKNGNGYRWYTTADVDVLRPYYAQFLDLDNLSFPENGLLTTFRAPGYPFFLAMIYALVPNSIRFMIVRIVQSLIIAFLAPFSAFIAYKLNCSIKTIIATGVFCSLYPILLFYPIGLASENLYMVLGVASLIGVIHSSQSKSNVGIIFSAILSGFTMLTRSIYSIYVLLIGFWIGTFRPDKRKIGILFILIAFGICTPWAIRNSIIMGKPTFVENSLGYNLFIGSHPEGNGGFISEIAIQPLNILGDAERESYCMNEAKDFILQNPVEAIRRVFARLGMLIGPETREFTFFYTNNFLGPIPKIWLICIYLLLTAPWTLLVLLGPIGLWNMRNEYFFIPINLFIFGYCLPHLFIMAEPRFHLAIVPILIPFMTYTIENRKKIKWVSLNLREHWPFVLIYLIIVFCFGIALFSNFYAIKNVFDLDGNLLRFSY
jgi:hypothetical protein